MQTRALSSILLASSILLGVAGLAALIYVADDISQELAYQFGATPDGDPVSVDANRPIPENNGKAVFLSDRLHAHGEILRDPLFGLVAFEAVLLDREVEVYYARRQTEYHRIKGTTIYTRNTSVRTPGQTIIEKKIHSQFGTESTDDEQEVPPFVEHRLEIFPALKIHPERINIGSYNISPECINPGAMGKREYPTFTPEKVAAFLRSEQSAALRQIMRDLDLVGIAIDPDDDASLILFGKSPEERADGDVRVRFSAVLPQPVGVHAIQKTTDTLEGILTDDVDEDFREDHLRDLGMQYAAYRDFEEYRTDLLYSEIHHGDLYLFGIAGVLLLLAAAALFAFWRSRA